jgi:8-oxo-dGTP diphosphatase
LTYLQAVKVQPMSHWLIHVAVGAIADASGRILIAKRPEHAHQGGLWEFPGGKLLPGETPQAGLARELAEELGIEVTASRPLIRVQHDYGDRRVLLDVHKVSAYRGVPEGREGQPLDWRSPEAMDPTLFPEADRSIITALQLPERYLITGADPNDPGVFLDRLQQALSSGIRLVQLRAHGVSDAAYRRLAGPVLALCRQTGARLILNRAPAVVADLDADGLHLPARLLAQLAERPGSARWLVGASCHNAADLARAVALGLDYALLSPVAATASHPDAEPLGWEGFAELVMPISLPVYALGGLGTQDLPRAFEHGAQGIAGIREFWPGLV